MPASLRIKTEFSTAAHIGLRLIFVYEPSTQLQLNRGLLYNMILYKISLLLSEKPITTDFFLAVPQRRTSIISKRKHTRAATDKYSIRLRKNILQTMHPMALMPSYGSLIKRDTDISFQDIHSKRGRLRALKAAIPIYRLRLRDTAIS